MKFRSSRILFLLLLPFSLMSQNVNSKVAEELDQKFTKYEIISPSIHKEAILADLKDGVVFQKLNIEGKEIELRLWMSNLITKDYVVNVQTHNGLKQVESSRPIAMQGEIVGFQNSKVSLTFNDGFIYGYVDNGQDTYFVEPVNGVLKNNRANGFVVYNAKDVIITENYTCGADMLKKVEDEVKPHGHGNRDGLCYTVEWAIASDWLMFNKYGSVSGVENHNIGVANNVQTNYDDEFADELMFEITEQWVSSCSSCDPWTSSTDATVLLNSFTNWGPSGFSASHDIGSLWTDRNFDGSIIGIAWVGVVCTDSRYNCLQDWSSDAALKRVMVAHEVGHNFSAEHDASGSPFIMAPAVQYTSSWSSASINDIENHYGSSWCLDACATSSPPSADFTFNIVENCTVGEVDFFDNSTGATSYFWEFEGGTPATSTSQNPTVTYENGGIFNVSLTAYNAFGQDTYTINDAIEINSTPIADFTYVIDEDAVAFINLSQFGIWYEWDFGDNFYASNSDPVHEYAEDGTYLVILTVTNDCGTTEYSEYITIATPPTAEFTSNITNGCEVMTVDFQSLASNNTTTWSWSFPGGNPMSSTDENPQVSYENAGVYQVSLIVSNPQGIDEIVKTAYINVQPSPDPSFNASVSGNTVQFTNTTMDATSNFWDFGDGNSSNASDPSHIYANEGTYAVTLTVTNACNEQFSYTQNVTISLYPTAGFSVETMQPYCTPVDISFTNMSQNSTQYLWSFEGGNPSTSSDENPIINYINAGSYDVTLISSNANGADTLVMADFVVIKEAPQSIFDFDAQELNVSFTNASTNGNSYLWHFGDGATSTEYEPSHSYTSQGTYMVVMDVTNECGTVSSSQEILAYKPIALSIAIQNAQMCVGDTLLFDSSIANATDYTWYFEGGNPASVSNELTPSVVYSSTGLFDVTIIASNPVYTDTLVMEDYISISAPPVASFSYNGNANVVQFVNTSQNAETYSWDFGDGTTSSEMSPSHTYPTENDYVVILTVGNYCGENTITQTVATNVPPIAGFSASMQESCAPFEVQYSDMSQFSVNTYEWSFEGGTPSVSDEANPSVTYQESGVFSVQLIVTNDVGADTLKYDNFITVHDVPTLSYTQEMMGNVLNLTNTSLNFDDYEWNVEDEVFQNQPLNYTFEANGTYMVKFYVSNECGSVEDSIEVEINVYPEISPEYSTNEICTGEEVSYALNGTNVTEVAWEFEGGSPATSTDKVVTVTYNNPGTFSVNLMASNQYGEVTWSEVGLITVIENPTADFIFSSNELEVQFENNSTSATEYFWNFGDGNTAVDKNPSHNYDKEGSYTVSLVVSNGMCIDTISKDVVVKPSGTFELDQQQLSFYPNPSSEKMNIEGSTINDLEELKIHSIDGRVIDANRIISKSSNKIILDSSQLVGGTYVLSCKFGDRLFVKKFVIIH
ncbi:MAG: PKD domain-containing protein [Lewinellaceae bacterium]|nr:PKD domain-containing protein [Lewinellaceae bacterium]